MKQTLADRISRALADRIIVGDIAPGSRLRQDHIAEEFATSHVPVREALQRLETQGLAVSEPRRGFRAAAFDLSEMREVAEMRAVLETLALRHAVPHLTLTLLKAAEEVIEVGEGARDFRAWERANHHFHRLLLEPCAMPRLLAAINDLHATGARFLFATWTADRQALADRGHRAIVAALRVGEVDVACATLARHVRWLGLPVGERNRL